VRGLEGNLWRYAVYKGLFNLFFFVPIWVLYLTERRGFTLAEAALVDSTFWIAIALSELPTGVVADRFGRRFSILIGLAVYGVSIGLYLIAPTLALFILANVLWGVGMSFVSGADQALLYDTLERLGRQREYAGVLGRVMALAHASHLVAALVGGALGEIDLALPYVATLVGIGACFAVAWGLIEPETTGKARPAYARVLVEAAGAVRGSRPLALAVLYYATLSIGPFLATVLLIQPRASELGLPVYQIGILITAVSGAALVGSWVARRAGAGLGESTILLAAPLLAAVAGVGLGVIGTAGGLVLALLVAFARATVMPHATAVLMNLSPETARATVTSLASLIYTLALAFLQPLVGALADATSISTALIAAGALSVLPVFAAVAAGLAAGGPPAATGTAADR
jgi:MFS family permease